MNHYSFPGHGEFLDRATELARLRTWWEDPRDRFPLIVYGRRRTGKSWLLREFAHGKNALIFVCDSRAPADQLAGFAAAAEPAAGVKPQFEDPAAFFSFLFRQQEAQLVVIDEFPFLLGTSPSADSALAAVMEQSGGSDLKLVLCGSQISTMTSLLAERAALHGRGTPLRLRPLPFSEARRFLSAHSTQEAITRFAVAGGMPLYLRRLGRPGSLRKIVCEDTLDPLGPLYDEVRELLMMELPSTATHFSLLAALAPSPSLAWDEVVARSRVEDGAASRYMAVLADLGLVEAANPVLATKTSRRRRYRIADHFIRFWFRFVFDRQPDLSAGLRPEDHFDRNIAPNLADHVAPVFEDICRSWILSGNRGIDTVGGWWGLARHDLRRRKLRSSEEIDVVGVSGNEVKVVGECRWQNRPMGRRVLDDLVDLKLPALAQTGAILSDPTIVLFAKNGFTPDLAAEAGRQNRIELVGPDDLTAAG